MTHSRMLRGICGVVFHFILLVQSTSAQLQGLHDEWRWAHFGIQSGLSSPQILNVLDLPSGTSWVHTREGVAWYDGFWWRQVPLDSVGPADLSQGCIAPMTDGVVLVIPPQLYHVTVSGATRLIPTENGKPISIQRAVALPNQEIMLQSDTALYLYGGGRAVLLPSPYQHELARVSEHQFGISRTSNGTIWLSAPHGLFRWANHGWQLWFAGDNREHVAIHAIVENFRGDGALSARIGDRQIRMEWLGDRVIKSITADPATVMTAGDIAPDGSIVSQEMSGVLDLRRGGKWEALASPPAQMLNARVFRFRPDGGLWVCTDRGLFLCALSSRRWTTLEGNFSAGSRSVNAIVYAPDSSLWVGTSDGIVVYNREEKAKWMDRAAGRRLGIVTGLGCDIDGNIWATSGASFEGAYRWDGKMWKHFGSTQGLTDSRIHKISRDRAGRLWFLTISAYAPGLRPELERGAFILDGGTFTNVGVKDGLLDNRLYAFAEDSTGARWFGSLEGLSRHKDGAWKHWTKKEGLVSSKVFTLAVDREGRLWFGHQFAGMGYIDEKDMVNNVNPAVGMTSRTVWNIVSALDGKLWVATREGLLVLNNGHWAAFGSREGLPNPYLWPILLTAGKAYIGTAGAGVAVLRYSDLEISPPRVRFDEPIIQGTTGILSWQVETPWEQIPSNAVNVRYQIDDHSWSEWTESRTVTLTGLGIGSHTLAVQPKGIVGQTSRVPETIEFQIPPPFYLRPAFYIPVLLLLLAVASLIAFSLRRKREYDQSLHEQDDRFRAVVEHQTELILRLLPDGKISFVNEAFCRLLNTVRENLVGQPFAALISRKGDEEAIDRIFQVTAQDGAVEFDLLFQPQGVDERWIRWSSSGICGDRGGVSEIQLIGRDITERKVAEEMLVRSEARYRIVAEQTGQIVYDFDVVHGSLAFQGAIEEITGYTSEEFSGITQQQWYEMIHEEDRAPVAVEFDRCLAAGGRIQAAYRIRHKNGRYITIHSNGILVREPGGKSVHLMGTLTDVTERKRSEALITSSLKEKEVLLKEIHHRVKNNLQVISSLLNLQAANVQDPKTLEQLKESQNRIRSMALIHERLYQSDDLARIDFGEYVRGLVSYLARSYSAPRVRVNIDVQDINLAVNAAIPCGLIINELVSNALKYAFPEGRSGTVWIRLVATEGENGVLTVEDDGIGLSRNIDFENTTTLGLQLVNTLTRQLNGTIVLSRDSGTAFSITFPVEG